MKLKKLVLTGAAGRLGSYLREPLAAMCDELLSTDIADDIGKLYDGERYEKADLAEMDQIKPLLPDEVEQPLIETVMQHAQGNQTRAASILGISRSTLRKKLAIYGLE